MRINVIIVLITSISRIDTQNVIDAFNVTLYSSVASFPKGSISVKTKDCVPVPESFDISFYSTISDELKSAFMTLSPIFTVAVLSELHSSISIFKSDRPLISLSLLRISKLSILLVL